MKNFSVCYKCGTDQELSIKKTQRSGKKQYICRSCRRKIYQFSIKPIKEQTPDAEWMKRAQESHNKLIARGVILK